MQVELLNDQGQAASNIDVLDTVFGRDYNESLVHQIVVAFQANARQGTRAQKDRGEVHHSTKKPFRQKGTGRARQGSTRAPQFTGGGVVHGPTPRDYEQRTPKKMKAAALRGALSDRARNGRVHVISAVVEGDAPSAKAAVATVASITDRRNVLVVVERDDTLGWKSLRNVGGVHLLVSDQLNTYDVLCSDDVVFTSGALQAFLAGPTKGKGAKAVATSTEAAAVAEAGTDKDEEAAK